MVSSAQHRRASRRKSCDYCSSKKIKCDQKDPECTACLKHGVVCSWTPGSHWRKTLPQPSCPEQSRNDERFAAMETRIRQLESAFHGRRVGGEPVKNRPSPPGNGVALPAIPDERSSVSMSTPDTASESGDDGPLALPPRDQVETIVQDYFTHLDPALPIFPREACLELVAKWYDAPAERSEVSWAIINTILALSLRGSPSDLMVERLAWAAQCVNNAQSCMNVLAYRNQDLKGLQVVLGLTVLFMESEHPYPACVFLATAVKLVHRLRLMTGVSLPSVHRSHLFWVTYILDRDLCLKTTEPYLIQDHDLDVDIDAHQAGVETSSDDQLTGLLETRVRLAKIQGKVYDYVYSVRASKLTPDQQEQSVNKLFLMLKAWYESLPPALKVDHTLQEDVDIKKRSMSLHLAFYHALFMAHSTHAFNPEWVAKLSQQDAQSPPLRLPSHWDRLIECSRACISLFNYITSQDLALQWASICATQAAITIIAAQVITAPQHGQYGRIVQDLAMIEGAVDEFGKRAVVFGDATVAMVHSTCSGLVEKCRAAAARYNEPTADDIFNESLF